MREKKIDSLNMLKFPHLRTGEPPFSVYWVSASGGGNIDNLNFRNHHHAFYELHCLVEGCMDYDVDGKIIRLMAGECMLIPSGCIHRVDSCDEAFIKLTVAFDLRDSTDDLGEYRTCKMSANMLQDVHNLFEEACSKSAYRSDLAELSATALVFHAADVLGISAVARKKTGDDRVLKAKLLMEDNPNIFFTCEELSGYCHVSVKQLGRLFKEHEGKGLLEYIHFQKLETAKRLLAEQDLSQKQLAQQLGFSDCRYFGRFFMRLTGMTPSEFRREVLTYRT